jgi:nucleoside-diphosphate-sugar epimerase
MLGRFGSVRSVDHGGSGTIVQGAADVESRTVVVTGARTQIGRLVLERLDGSSEGVEHGAFVAVDVPVTDDAAPELPIGTSVVVHLVPGDHDTLERHRRSALEGTRALLGALEAQTSNEVAVVLLSSAMVYGAWPNNPVPLTEDAPVRPDGTFAFARQLADVEQLVDSWRATDPVRRRVAVLRPVPTMAADGTSRIVGALAAGYGTRAGEDDAPGQFLHRDDLVEAIILAVRERLDGVFNVAPDGAIDAATLRALAGAPPRVRLPAPLADFVAQFRWRFQRGPIPPGLRPYIRWPWLVANDRLRAVGWRPTVTNEQVYVEGTESRWWTMITPKRKQELALGLSGAVVLAFVVGVVRFRLRRVARRR